MKRGFIRGLWGVYDNSHRLLNRRFGVDKDIHGILNNQFNQPFTAYVMGEENYKKLLETGIENLGHKVIMLCKEPFMFDLIQFQYRNKMEVIRYAMENDGYDEIVYLDWDCVPKKPLPDNFWEEQGKKEPFQACLQRYKSRMCLWRQGDAIHIVPNGGYLYMRDKSIPEKSIKIWEEEIGPTGSSRVNDEISWAKYLDNICGGWKGNDFYYEKFETMFCNLHRMSPLDNDRLNSKNVCFMHYQG